MQREMTLEYCVLQEGDPYPYDLLLLADETITAINKYIHESVVYLVKNAGNPIAVFCLYTVDSTTVEIKNIAVATAYQNRGIGSHMLAFIKEHSRYSYSKIIVGTADVGIDQIRFYERHGFRKFGIRKDFFIDNYEQPIIENGITLRNMILLGFAISL